MFSSSKSPTPLIFEFRDQLIKNKGIKMASKKISLGLLAILMLGCNSTKKEIASTDSYAAINIAGVMKNVV